MRRAWGLVVIAAALLAPQALAQPAPQPAAAPAPPEPAAAPSAPAPPITAEAKARAKTLYLAGVQAFKAGRFAAALQAFESAYALQPVVNGVYNIARAQHMLYAAEGGEAPLRAALDGYRGYLEQAPDGKFRLEATRGLAELLPFEAPLAAAGAAPRAEAPRAATRLLVMSSAPGAMVSLDGGEPVVAPLVREAAAGPHRVSVTAAGYVTAERELAAVEGALVPLDVPLQGQPAALSVLAPDGADIAVDGEVRGTLPLPEPLPLDAGRHTIAVLQTGHEPFVAPVEVAWGERRELDASLRVTPQRVASGLLLATGGAALAAGGVLLGLGLERQAAARDILDRRDAASITLPELDDYRAAAQDRDDYLLGAGITAAVGGALGVTGILLFALDRPEAPRGAQPVARPDEPDLALPAELEARLLLGPDGVTLLGRF